MPIPPPTLNHKTEQDKLNEKVGERTRDYARKIGLSDYYAFIHFAHKHWQITLADDRPTGGQVRHFVLPVAAAGYFPVRPKQVQVFSLSPTQQQERVIDPIISSSLPFFTLLQWQSVTVRTADGRITFREAHHNGVVFSLFAEFPELALSLADTGTVTLGLFKDGDASPIQQNVPIIKEA